MKISFAIVVDCLMGKRCFVLFVSTSAFICCCKILHSAIKECSKMKMAEIGSTSTTSILLYGTDRDSVYYLRM